MEKYQAYLTVIARVLMGVAFIWFGYTKLFVFTPAGTAQYLANVWHAPAPGLSAWIAIIIELLGGLAILLGFQTRWAAAVLALWCLLTGFGFHLPAGDPDNLGQFFKNITMASGFIYIFAFGPGALSIDHAMGTEKV
jgi:putative oxidoreductase